MDDHALISLLQSLSQLEIDTCHGYRRAAHRVDEHPVRVQLEAFWQEHERHVDELAAEIRRLGGTPPPFERDASGIIIETFTRVRAATGTSGALKALKTNERLTNAAYGAALKEDLPESVRETVERHRADEHRHLTAIREILARPEHRGPGLSTMLAGAALVTAGAAAAVWAIARWRSGPPARAGQAAEPGWLVRKAPPGAPLAEAPEREGVSDFGDAAQIQAPGRPPNLALHEEGDQTRGERTVDETTKNRGGLP